MLKKFNEFNGLVPRNRLTIELVDSVALLEIALRSEGREALGIIDKGSSRTALLGNRCRRIGDAIALGATGSGPLHPWRNGSPARRESHRERANPDVNGRASSVSFL